MRTQHAVELRAQALNRAPTLQINKEDHFKVTPSELKALLETLKTEGVKLGPPVGWLAEQHHAHAAHA